MVLEIGTVVACGERAACREAQGLFLWWRKRISSLRCCLHGCACLSNSWNCTLKICHVCVCKIYVKKKKKERNLTQVWVIRIDQQRARLKMSLPPLSLQFIQGLLSHVASLLLVHTEESRTELEGLVSTEQLCPFLSLEMRKIIPGPPCGICFCSDSLQIPDYLTPLGDSGLQLNQYRAILSEHSRRLRRCVQGGLHQNVTSADTRETRASAKPGNLSSPLCNIRCARQKCLKT